MGRRLRDAVLSPPARALEIVPLVLIGFEAWENIRLARVKQWTATWKGVGLTRNDER